jgi:hypothetical protein
MNKLPLALFISIFFLKAASAAVTPAAKRTGHPAFRSGTAAAKKILGSPSPSPSPGATSGTPATAGAVTANASPTPKPSFLGNVRFSYFGEYLGPRISNLDLTRTQGPNGQPEYTSISHSLKAGYKVAKNVIVGAQFGALSPFDPTQTFQFNDTRLFANWANMVDTKDLNMQGVLKLQLPTTEASRNRGRIMALQIQNNWTLKTELRNWSFTASTLIMPFFNNEPQGKPDLFVGFFPYVTVDLTPKVQLMFEASFDAIRTYNDPTFEFAQADSDYVDIGPVFNLNSNVSLTTALRFFTEMVSIKNSCLYLNVSAAI